MKWINLLTVVSMLAPVSHALALGCQTPSGLCDGDRLEFFWKRTSGESIKNHVEASLFPSEEMRATVPAQSVLRVISQLPKWQLAFMGNNGELTADVVNKSCTGNRLLMRDCLVELSFFENRTVIAASTIDVKAMINQSQKFQGHPVLMKVNFSSLATDKLNSSIKMMVEYVPVKQTAVNIPANFKW